MKKSNLERPIPSAWLKVSICSLIIAGVVISCTKENERLEVGDSIMNELSQESVELSYSSITASTEQEANPISNIDDDGTDYLSTRWSGFGTSVNVDIDLEAEVIIDYVNIAFYNGDQRASSFSYWTSSDGLSWVEVGTQVSSGETEDHETFDLDDMNTRYLRLVFEGNTASNWNSVLDLEIYGLSEEVSNNVALEKTTSQSSTDYSGESGRAVDGNTSGLWADGSVTHTTNSVEPWWQVDLQESYNIGNVVVYNRTNTCCVSRLSDFYVDVLSTEGVVVSSIYVEDAPTPSVTLNFEGAEGSQVQVRLAGTNALSLAEVEVYEFDGEVVEPPIPGETDITSVVEASYLLSNDVTVTVNDDGSITIGSTGLPEYNTPYYGSDSDMYADFPTFTLEEYPNLEVLYGAEELDRLWNDDRTAVTYAANANETIISWNYRMTIPSSPEEADVKEDTDLGLIGLALNGVPIYNDLEGRDVLGLIAMSTFDTEGAHPGPNEDYHYHTTGVFGAETTVDDADLVGFIRDGFPLYGRQHMDGTYPDDLDENGGHIGVTADFSDEIYHYHASSENYLESGWYVLKAGAYHGTPGTFTD